MMNINRYERNLRHLAGFCLGVCIVSSALPTTAQPVTPAATEAPGETSTVIELSMADLPDGEGLKGAWLELSPLRGGGPTQLHRFNNLGAPDEEADDQASQNARFEPKIEQGPAMICFGAVDYAVACERRFIHQASDPDDPVQLSLTDPADRTLEDLTITVAPIRGSAIVGRLVQDGFAVAEGRISLVPAELISERPFTVPLVVEEPAVLEESASKDGKTFELRRFVLTDDKGEFAIPPIAAGDYMLEAHLPSSQLHRFGPFSLSEPAAAREGSDSGDILPLNLGEIDVPVGLSLEIRALNQDGLPVAGAIITARQGSDPVQWLEFRAESDADGEARMSGLSAESSVTVICEAPGHQRWQADFELLPVAMECELPEYARLVGAVTAADAEIDLLSRDGGEPIPDSAVIGVGVSAVLLPGTGIAEQKTMADAWGTFVLDGLAPGDWRLTLAAAGFEAKAQDISLAAGQTLDLGLIYLPAAKSILGRVVAAEDGTALAGATIRAIAPWGAADTISDPEGQFEVTATDDRSLELSVSAEDRPAVRVVWSPQAQQSGERIVELAKGGWIRVLVGSEGDEPCAGCTLHIVPPASVRRQGGPIPSMETDSRGEALSVALTPGGYYVQQPRLNVRGTSVVETRDADQRFARVKAGEISTVRFETASDPKRDALRLRLRPLDRIGTRSTLSVRTPIRRQRAVAEGDGVFRVRRDPGQSSDVFLLRWNESTQFEDLIYLGPLVPRSGPALGSGVALGIGGSSGIGQSEPSAEPGETVTLELSASHIFGRLETFSGDRVAGVRIRLRDVAGNRFLGEARSDSEGIFRIEDMTPGVYSLLIGERVYQFVSILAGQTVDLGTFQLIPGAY